MQRIAILGPPLLVGGAAAALAPVAGWQVGSDDAAVATADVLVLVGRDAIDRAPPGVAAVLLLDQAGASGAGPRWTAPLALLGADATAEQLRAAVAAVLAGLSVRDPAFGWIGSTGVQQPDADHEPLTPREQEVFELVGKGLSNRDIGGVLGISAHTAKYHVGQILAKVGAATRAEAVATGLRLGVIGI